jgi:hypothetical protein
MSTKAIEQHSTTVLSLLTEELMNKNCGLNPLIAAASRANRFGPAET